MLSGNPCIMKTHTSAHNPLTFVKTQHTSGTGLSLCKDLVNFHRFISRSTFGRTCHLNVMFLMFGCFVYLCIFHRFHKRLSTQIWPVKSQRESNKAGNWNGAHTFMRADGHTLQTSDLTAKTKTTRTLWRTHNPEMVCTRGADSRYSWGASSPHL